MQSLALLPRPVAKSQRHTSGAYLKIWAEYCPFKWDKNVPLVGPAPQFILLLFTVAVARLINAAAKQHYLNKKTTTTTNKKINFNLYAFFFFFYQACFYTTQKLWIGRELQFHPDNKGVNLVVNPSRWDHITHRSCNFTNRCKCCISRRRCSHYAFRVKEMKPANDFVRERCQELKTFSHWMLPCLVDFFALTAEKTTCSIHGGLYLHCTCNSTKYWPSASGFYLCSLLSAVACITFSYLDRD